MSKLLTITVRVEDAGREENVAYSDVDEVINLLTGISGGQVDGSVLGAFLTEEIDHTNCGVDDAPIDYDDSCGKLAAYGFSVHASKPVVTVGELATALSIFPNETPLRAHPAGESHYVTFDGDAVVVGYNG